MTETRHSIQSAYLDTRQDTTSSAEMALATRQAIIAKLARQVGSISQMELELALDTGWRYGKTLTDTPAPNERAISDMARQICGIPTDRMIDTDHFVPVMDALDQSARAATRTVQDAYHVSTTSEHLLTSV
jgi:hypothetical protein